MQPAFDPYHLWLGIPREEQPPNHYRLLGVPTFEPNPEVIEHAADQRMAHLRTFQAGKYSAHSQRLLNEIATAKVCLLKVTAKAAYDAQLRELIVANAPPASVQQPASLPVPPTPSRGTTTSSSASRTAVAILVAVLASIVLAGIVVLSIGRRTASSERHAAGLVRGARDVEQGHKDAEERLPVGGPPRTAQPDQPRSPATRPPAVAEPQPRASVNMPPAHLGDTPRQAAGPKAGVPTPVAPTTASPTGSTEEIVPEKSPPPPTVPAEPRPSPAPKASVEPTPAPAAPAQLPVPDDLEQEKALALVRDLYKVEYEKATSAEAQRALAKKILEKGVSTTDSPAARFVLLRLARDVSVRAGDGATACEAVDELGKSFQINAPEMKCEIVHGMVRSAQNREERGAAVEQIIRVMDEAIAADQFAVFDDLYRLGLSEAGKLRDKDLLVQIRALRKEADDGKRAYALIEPALATLKANPHDPAANLVVGRHLCFTKEAWNRGLVPLAQGSDPALKSLAAQDLTSSGDRDTQIKIADGWWSMAEGASGKQRQAILRRAGHWYRRAGKISDELTASKVQTRLAAIVMQEQTGSSESSAASQLVLRKPSRASGGKGGRVLPQSIEDELRLDRAHGPYIVTSQLVVAPGGSLLFERGTTVLMAAGASILARGRLNSYGDIEDFVRFRPETAGAPFDKIRLEKGVDHLLERFDIRGANCGIYIDEHCHAEITDCLLLSNRVGAETRRTDRETYWFRNCMIANNLTDGVSLYLNRVGFDHCTIAGNGGVGLNMTYYGHITATGCDITGNQIGIASRLYDTGLEIKESNIVGNRVAAIEIKTKDDFQCPGNYWGTSNVQQILMAFRDGRMKPGLGMVRFEPFEKKAVQDAGCTLKVPRER